MIANTSRTQRWAETRSLPVGVFEDDALLLRLDGRSRFAEADCQRVCGAMNSDDLAVEIARLADCEAWNL
jgi:hypothetical protein